MPPVAPARGGVLGHLTGHVRDDDVVDRREARLEEGRGHPVAGHVGPAGHPGPDHGHADGLVCHGSSSLLKRFKARVGHDVSDCQAVVLTKPWEGMGVGTRPPRPRLEDVAARAAVSPATASLVLRERPGPSPSTRRRVLAAAAELGYRPDRSASLLARRRTHLLGVTMDVSNPFHAELLDDIHAAASLQGFDVVISPLNRVRTERQTVESLLDQRCEALLLLGPTLPRSELVDLARHNPVVVVGRRVDAPGIGVVRAADELGVAQAVSHLVDLGHRRIAFVDGPSGPVATLRRQGFRSEVRRLLGVAHPTVVAGGDTEKAGAGARLVSNGGLTTAVVTFNDRAALGVMDQLRSRGLAVPDDLSIVGFDDSPVARLGAIALTTVSQRPREMAAAAVDAALHRIDGDPAAAPSDLVLEPRLMVRRTTSPPPCDG